MTPDQLLAKVDKIITDWNNCQIKKEEAKKQLLQVVKEFDLQMKLL